MKASAGFRLRLAADVLLSGGVIAHPTEAVWGLACLPDDGQAVSRILDLKQRDPEKGLILVADSETRFAPLLERLPESVLESIRSSWPGPTTWVVPDLDGWVPAWVRGRHSSVAIRVTDHPLTSALCRRLGMPLVSTSANPAGLNPATTALRARRYFADRVDYYLTGSTGGLGRPTTIVDALAGDVLRN